MSTPGSERQYNYRMNHPQINVTFRDQKEHYTVWRACVRTGRKPREVLLNWAQLVLSEIQQSERAGKPNADNSSGHAPAVSAIEGDLSVTS